MNRILVLLISALFILAGCGKPNDPESINPGGHTGGYKIEKRFTTPGYAQDVVIHDNMLLIAQGEGGLLIVDVSNPLNPQTVSVTTDGVRGYCNRLAVKDSIAYLTAGSFGINVIDISDPSVPEVTVSNLNVKPAKNVTVMGDYLYTAISEQGINISDISFPAFPDIRGDLWTTGYAMSVKISSDTTKLFAACGEMGFSMHDLSDFQQGYGTYPRIGWCDTPGYAEDIEVLEDESVAFLACGTSGLQIINYADTSNVYLMGSYDGAGYAKTLKYRDDKVYMACQLGGLQIIDVSVLSNPKLIGTIETEYAMSLCMDENYIYLVDEDEGLIIISIP